MAGDGPPWPDGRGIIDTMLGTADGPAPLRSGDRPNVPCDDAATVLKLTTEASMARPRPHR
jgi:hypothetical protein